MTDKPEEPAPEDLEEILAERIAEYRICLLPLEDELYEAAEQLEDIGE